MLPRRTNPFLPQRNKNEHHVGGCSDTLHGRCKKLVIIHAHDFLNGEGKKYRHPWPSSFAFDNAPPVPVYSYARNMHDDDESTYSI